MNAESIILEARDIAIHYGGVKALDGVSFQLEKGEIHGLIGPNGAGKSTVIDAITGRRKLTRGSVRLDGRDISGLDIIQRRRRGLARSFQRTSIFANLDVREQVVLAAHKVGADAPEQEALEVMGQLDLLSVAHVPAKDLGYGQQRRLDLALALVGRPMVLLLDEPMAGLSPQESRELAEHLLQLARDWNVSVLLVEHDTDILFDISDTVTVFELGRVIANGSPETVRTHPRVKQAYLGSAA
ncbi:ABC transporter ATP-binding protein [uncultured Castellaniella sp.]|uniref:ABC transporter ATP-binding protein n=1 Tax=uncultured Castellaniella sp. TaxID=647907 RepID=UPI002624BD46|nr:ABC transporter ATP-binding protein [uncultured Castellaniella sp.]